MNDYYIKAYTFIIKALWSLLAYQYINSASNNINNLIDIAHKWININLPNFYMLSLLPRTIEKCYQITYLYKILGYGNLEKHLLLPIENYASSYNPYESQYSTTNFSYQLSNVILRNPNTFIPGMFSKGVRYYGFLKKDYTPILYYPMEEYYCDTNEYTMTNQLRKKILKENFNKIIEINYAEYINYCHKREIGVNKSSQNEFLNIIFNLN